MIFQVVRLEEKERYLQLLSQYTDSSLVKSLHRTDNQSLFPNEQQRTDSSVNSSILISKPPQIPQRKVHRYRVLLFYIFSQVFSPVFLFFIYTKNAKKVSIEV